MEMVPLRWAQLGDKGRTPDPLWGGHWDLASGLQAGGHTESLGMLRARVSLCCTGASPQRDTPTLGMALGALRDPKLWGANGAGHGASGSP